jgi:hypothetical protein
LNVKQKFAYIYDFGDEHWFKAELIVMHDMENFADRPDMEIRFAQIIKCILRHTCTSFNNTIA